MQARQSCQPKDKGRSPTTKTALNLEQKLQDLKLSGNVSEEKYKKLQVSDPNPASFRGLPKVHKVEPQPDNDPLINEIEELNRVSMRLRDNQVSKCLAKRLRTLQADYQYTVRNSTEFAEFVLSQRVTDDEEDVIFDVVLLFTSIPVKLKIKLRQSHE